MNIHGALCVLTKYVRESKGSGEALRFYVDFIQPIKEYFGGDDNIKNIEVHTPIKENCVHYLGKMDDAYEMYNCTNEKQNNVCFNVCSDYAEIEIDKQCKLLLNSDRLKLLYSYSVWLTKNGYMDTDWKDEKPYAIDEFILELNALEKRKAGGKI